MRLNEGVTWIIVIFCINDHRELLTKNAKQGQTKQNKTKQNKNKKNIKWMKKCMCLRKWKAIKQKANNKRKSYRQIKDRANEKKKQNRTTSDT